MKYSLVLAIFLSSAANAAAPFNPAFHDLRVSVLKENYKYYPNQGAYPQTIALYYGGPGVGTRAAGVFDSQVSPDTHANIKIGRSEFIKAWNRRSAQGYLPRDISAYDDNTHIAQFSVIWEKANVPAAFYIDMDDAGFTERYKEYTDQGYRLSEYARYTTRVGNRHPVQKHLAVFRKDGQGFFFYTGIDVAEVRRLIAYHEARGFMPTSINAGTYTTSRFFSVIFGPKHGFTHVGLDLTSAGYQQDFDTYNQLGYRLMKVTGYSNGDRLATIWRKQL